MITQEILVMAFFLATWAVIGVWFLWPDRQTGRLVEHPKLEVDEAFRKAYQENLEVMFQQMGSRLKPRSHERTMYDTIENQKPIRSVQDSTKIKVGVND